MEMKKGEEPQREDHHGIRSSVAHDGVLSRIDRIWHITSCCATNTPASPNRAGNRAPPAKRAPCLFPSDVFYLSAPKPWHGLEAEVCSRRAWSPTTAAQIPHETGRAGPFLRI